MKKLCMFCMRSHKKKPKLCQAKGDIVRAYMKEGLQLWQVMHGIESGLIKFEAEALELVSRRNKAAK